MEFYVTQINWDVDCENDLAYLPSSAFIECDDESEIADALSDLYGFLVKSFIV